MKSARILLLSTNKINTILTINHTYIENSSEYQQATIFKTRTYVLYIKTRLANAILTGTFITKSRFIGDSRLRPIMNGMRDRKIRKSRRGRAEDEKKRTGLSRSRSCLRMISSGVTVYYIPDGPREIDALTMSGVHISEDKIIYLRALLAAGCVTVQQVTLRRFFNLRDSR